MKDYIHNLIRECWRFPFRMYMKSRIRNHSVRILSSNCGGAVCYMTAGCHL